MPTPLLLAHQGGWDELLLFGLPVVLYAALRLYDRYRRTDEEDLERDRDESRPANE